MPKQNRRSKRGSIITDSSMPEVGHSERRVHDLEEQNEALKREIEELKCRLGNVSPTSVDGNKKQSEDYSRKLHALDDQVTELKKRLDSQCQLSMRKWKNAEAGRLPQDEIQKLKAQKVQLLCKMKLDSVQFRLVKASLEKEVLQLKKEQRRNEYEMRKLMALSQRQKLVLLRKTEEASVATKRLNDLLESRKASCHGTSGARNGNSPGIQGMDLELKVAARVEEIRSEFDRQMEEMAEELRKFEEEAETLRQENFSFLLQDKEADCKLRDSELRDLKEEVGRLSIMVSQLGITKPQVQIKKPQVDLDKSSGSIVNNELVGTDSSASEYCGENVATVGKTTPVVCCSCSRKSLCKTTKCECRAAGGCCGTRCGCTASKCTNRVVNFSKVDESAQLQVTGDVLQCSGTSTTEKGTTASIPAELNNDRGPRRKPLSEVDNTLITSSPVKPGKKTRGRKPIVQLDATDPSLQPENSFLAKQAEKISLGDIPVKLTRPTRTAVLNKNP